MNKNKQISNLKILLVLFLCAFQIYTYSQEAIIQQVPNEEQNAVEAIALYPEKERIVILEAASHPEILVRMQNIQKNSEMKFKSLLENLLEEEQKKIFNLSRYPDLIQKITQNKKSKEELNQLLINYPKEIQEQAIFANQNHFPLLININKLFQDSELALENVLKNYPQQTQQAYKELLKLPEVVNILVKNMNATVLLGDLYKNKPSQLKKELDSLNVVIAEQKTKELNEWKQNLEDDPDAMKEYEQATKEFASSEGIDESNYTTHVPEEKKTEVEIRYIYQPYPYWFGWPWWYTYEIWYPYPYWYHCGYYYNPENVIVFIGLPSNYYMQWHFHHHTHFYHYPHFTNHVVNHYYGHRKSRSSITTIVRDWEKEVRPEVPNNFLANDKNRAERIKEYGKFKMDYQATITKTNKKVPNQYNYLKNNANKYPSLKPVLKEKPTTSVKTPIKKKEKPTRDFNVPKYQPKEKTIKSNRSVDQEIDRAKKYHQNTWKKSIPKYQKPPRQKLPRQRVPRQKKNPRKTNR